MDQYQELWNQVLTMLREDLAEMSYNELFKDSTECYKFENDYIYVIVPSVLTKYRIEQYYQKKIRELIPYITDKQIGFKFITAAEVEAEKKDAKENKFVIPDRPIGRNLSSLYRFDNFEVGESNRYAFVTAMKVAENGVEVCNPLYIFGDVGLGKTHLMTSIGNYILDNDIRTNVIYTSSQKFAEDYFLATSTKGNRDKIEQFYNKYNSSDVLLVDDIQFLEGKNATQEEFFKIFEYLVSSNKQIVITSDRPASSLKNVMSRLKSRFSMGITVDIKQPDKLLLINILKNKLSFLIADPNDVGVDVLEILASYFPTNIRELEGALRTYVNYCICMGCAFTKENLYIALETLLPNDVEKVDNNKITIENVKKVVCEYYKVSKEDILSSSRKQQIAYARQMLMYILRTNYNIPLQTIGDNLGSRDHATIAHGIDKITTQMRTNELTKADYDLLTKKISEI